MKIFGVGLSRTGTTSLNRALEILGYRSIHYPTPEDDLDEYDAATDITISAQFRLLDKKYPNSKFILTVRDIESWIESMSRHYKKYPPSVRSTFVRNIRKKVYGIETFDSTILKERYKIHYEQVNKYFEDRSQDLLEMNIIKGDGWDKLCVFLNTPVPEAPFPHLNTS